MDRAWPRMSGRRGKTSTWCQLFTNGRTARQCDAEPTKRHVSAEVLYLSGENRCRGAFPPPRPEAQRRGAWV
eukprot:4980665-Pyramimonas_sp.AAC.1